MNEKNSLLDSMRRCAPALSELPDEDWATVFSSFIRQDPAASNNSHMELISFINEGRGGAQSRKIGNIALSWSTLFRSVPGLVLTAAGVVSQPWLVPLAALAIWNELSNQATVELGVKHAAAIKAIWESTRSVIELTEEQARDATNDCLKKFDENSLGVSSFAVIINDLDRMGCLRLKDGRIRLMEAVSVS